jgi:nucleotide-binding universal stress UspA family protein
MSYKTILVHVDESARASERVKIATAVAKAEKAHLIGLAVTGASRYLVQGRTLEDDPNLRLHLEAMRQRAQRGLDDFESCVRKHGLQSFETRLVDDEAGGGICLQARYADMVVIGQNDPDEVSPVVMPDFPQFVILNCGRPVLLIPHAGHFDAIGKNVLIGWDGSVAAIRAVSGALPLLRHAPAVKAIMFMEEGRKAGLTRIDLEQYLARHGVQTEVLQRQSTGEVGSALLATCGELECDLLVMGGYGHSRFREILLGGVTRSVLTEMRVPVLMAH